mgnify:CR=1 FL=1
MSVQDFVHEVYHAAAFSSLCGIPVVRRLTATAANIRVPVHSDAFIDAFYNEQTGRTAFALIRNNQRLFGADNTGGWHLHPFHDPQQHIPLSSPLSFAEFLRMLEQQVSFESPRP